MSLFYCVNFVCLCGAEGAYILYYMALVANTVAKRALSPTKIRTNLEIWLLFARNLAAFLFFAANGGAVFVFARRAADFSARHLPLRSVGIACGSH